MKSELSVQDASGAPDPDSEGPGPFPWLSQDESERLVRLKRSILRHYPAKRTPNRALLEKAFTDAEFHHRDQRRQSGEPYIFHPARVGLMVAEAGLDLETVIVSLLHDVIEDTEVTKAEMGSAYGEWLADMVDGLTKVVKPPTGRNDASSLQTYRKLISSTLKDPRTVQVKIFDRLDNMRDLGYLSRARQRRISTETLTVLVPMATRLGMQEISDELTALCFRYLYPKRFKECLLQLKQRIVEERGRIRNLKALMEVQVGRTPGLKFTVEPKYAVISSFIHSTGGVQRALEGFQVRVPDAQDCYRALGALHMNFRVVPNSIKDYISNPRPNRYQALHSQIFIAGEATAITVVSEAMERVNALGILAGWERSREDMERYYDSYLELLDHYAGDNDDLRMEDVLRHARMDTLQLLTPKGKLLTFPPHATVLDFAFAIHSDLGQHCEGARMGGRRVSRFEELRDGEMVEVLAHPQVTPQPVWLDHVLTSRAKLGVRRFLNAQSNARAQEVGRKLFAAELGRLGLDASTITAGAPFLHALEKRGATLNQLYHQVGLHKLSVRRFLLEHQLVEGRHVKRLEGQEKSLLKRYLKPIFRRPEPVLKVGDLDDGFMAMAACCTPLPGDAIVGVREALGIKVHRAVCSLLDKAEPQTLISLGWESSTAKQPYRLEIRVTQDRPGLLYRVSKAIADCKVNIIGIGLHREQREGSADIHVELEAIPIKTFRAVVTRVRGIKDVERIRMVPPAQGAPSPVSSKTDAR